jgi:transcriptional repressor NrdR
VVSIRYQPRSPPAKGQLRTIEQVGHLRELTVIKENGRREPFDRDKLARSINTAS